MSLQVIVPNECVEIRREFDKLGYCPFTPEAARVAFGKVEAPVVRRETEGMLTFETGSLVKDQVEAILNTLPVEITFVDKEDTVRYFSRPKEGLFLRTKAALGRRVQQCHPQKSVHVVNRILDDFKAGYRDVAEFWINFKGKLVYIRYFPVREKNGEYLGCLEVVQDITDIKRIEGEKRLLDDGL